ncbi:hypothetical protein AMTRI_Chr10g4140 [Amborella trichopoda]
MATYRKDYLLKGLPEQSDSHHRVRAAEDVDCKVWWRIWSRRSSISPEFVDSVQIYNGKSHVRFKITKGKAGHKYGEFASTQKRRPLRTIMGPER